MQHPALTISIGIADQTNEQEAKKQGAEEIISAILIGDDAEICALLFTGQLQVDLIEEVIFRTCWACRTASLLPRPMITLVRTVSLDCLKIA